MNLIPLTPVILSGGSGTRLWPISRAERPKQFIALTAPQTMFALTLGRTEGVAESLPPIIVGNAAHANLLSEQAGDAKAIILEPCARNTAPAIALAALALDDLDHLMLVMPSDHVIADLPAFHAAIAAARLLAEQGWLVTFGITPDAPETGYGYIGLGDDVGSGVKQVARFVEKPDQAKAQAMLDTGGYVWNAGIFLFSGRAYLDALRSNEPAMAEAAQAAMASARQEGTLIWPDAEAFAASPSNSIDYSVMERSDKVACVPVSMGWSDVGSWDSLYAIAPKDEAANALDGPARVIDASGCMVRSEGPRITLLGVEDLIVIATADDVIILPRNRSQDVKRIVDLNKAQS